MTRAAAVIALVLLVAGCGGDSGDAGARDDAERAAIEHVGERDADETTVESEVENDTATVTITFDGLLDDSVTAERHVVTLERRGESWHVVADRAEFRCHSGRGHGFFAPELCR